MENAFKMTLKKYSPDLKLMANNPVNRTAGNTHRSRQLPCPAAGYLERKPFAKIKPR
jgi:hypothetical protein